MGSIRIEISVPSVCSVGKSPPGFRVLRVFRGPTRFSPDFFPKTGKRCSRSRVISIAKRTSIFSRTNLIHC